MRILYVTTIGNTMRFFFSFITELVNSGHTVDIATNENNGETAVTGVYRKIGCKIFPISCSRSPISKGNVDTVKEIRKIVSDKHYDIVHCHTPIAASCTRLACRTARTLGTKVIYTAHGFHFYTGAPLKNWVLFYPIEKLCSRWTDVLITINEEDYKRAKKHFRTRRIEYVPGVGIDIQKFAKIKIDRDQKRKELAVPKNAFLLLSVGELNKNKNHEIIIRAIADLHNKDIHYAIVGKGDLYDYLHLLAKRLGVEKQIHILGFREDVAELYKMADICCFPSIREGLGLAAIEGMASGLPIVAANNRGTKEYVKDGENGYLCAHNDRVQFVKAICRLYQNPSKAKKMGESGSKDVLSFDTRIINRKMKNIYLHL